MKNIIAYYRVSTREQGQSGLGLDAQRQAIEKLGHTIIASYTDVASGRKDNRTQLALALDHAKKLGATLTVAKLDRLSRRVSFTAMLLEGKVEILVADNPQANTMLLHMLSVFAESEAKAISDRTKAALEMAKKRGVLLGSARPGHWDGREHLRGNSQNKQTVAPGLLNQVKQLRNDGHTLQDIADRLNAQGVKTVKGCGVTTVQVSRWLKVVA